MWCICKHWHSHSSSLLFWSKKWPQNAFVFRESKLPEEQSWKRITHLNAFKKKALISDLWIVTPWRNGTSHCICWGYIGLFSRHYRLKTFSIFSGTCFCKHMTEWSLSTWINIYMQKIQKQRHFLRHQTSRSKVSDHLYFLLHYYTIRGSIKCLHTAVAGLI